VSMDFSHMEDAVYGGDLENDQELLAELEALAGGGIAASAAPVRRPAAPAAPPARRAPAPVAAAPPPPKRQAPAQRELCAADLERALRADVADADADDAQLEDGLEDELAALMGEEEEVEEAPRPPPIPARSAPAAPPPSATPPALPPRGSSTAAAAPAAHPHQQAGYLRRLGDHYAKMQKAETNELKANRYKRSVDKCRELEKRAAAGRPVDAAEIPLAPPGFAEAAPAAAAAAPPAPAARPAASVPTPAAPEPAAVGDPKMQQIKQLLTRRRDLFVANAKAAVAAKDKAAAQEYVAASKQFDEAIGALDAASAEDIDPAEIPPSPPPYRKKITMEAATFEEGLQKRKARFDEMAADCKAKGDDRRCRMHQRAAASYADAIKAASRGQTVEVSDLPPYPDFPPLPKQQPTSAATAAVAARPKPPAAAPSSSSIAASVAAAAARSGVSDQLAFVMERQRQFKVAALAAKNAGNMELAKKYLTDAKGFDRMIQACNAGLNVDISKTPIPPQVSTSKATLQPHVEGESQRASTSDDRDAILATLEKDLITQVTVAENNRLRFTRLGDVAKVRQFEEWAKTAKQDLILVREVARRGGLRTPQFHREQRLIPSADFFPDLAEDVMEMTIINAVDVPLPAGYESEHANLYVKYTLPYPTDAPQTGKTKYAAGSRSPNWNETIVLQIGSKKARGSKLMRVLKRLPLKLEVYQKGGFLRSDKLIGTGECKLDGLETKAEVEEGAPLKEGRKATGGVVSARVRVREPLGDTKGAARTINWLVIDV
ncbi:hypothetical protein PENTCL1PPCAC_23749, partial [Pristionchus entomophagus]